MRELRRATFESAPASPPKYLEQKLGVGPKSGLCGVRFVEYIMKPETVDKVRKRAAMRKAGLSIGEDEPWSCDEIPPPLFYVGLEQFNRGEYFEQHESLEEIWLDDPRPLRRLYQGILKIGVGFYKLRLCNYRGTVNHISGGIAYLQPFGDTCLGVDIARLIREASAVRDQAVALGPDRLSEFDLSTLPKVHYTPRP
jgi:uncharacterized protein